MNKVCLGPVSAYALAKDNGYNGTETEFGKGLADAALNADRAEDAAERAEAVLESVPLEYQEATQAIVNNQNAILKLGDETTLLERMVTYKRVYSGSVETEDNQPLYAENIITRADIPADSTYAVTCYFDSHVVSSVGAIYEKYVDGTSRSIVSNPQSDEVYQVTAGDDVVGFSAYVAKGSVTGTSTFTIKAEKTNANSLEKLQRYFEYESLSNDDVEYGAIQNGTGSNKNDGDATRMRTKGFIPLISGSVVRGNVPFNVWEYTIDGEYITDNGNWTNLYTVSNDCLARIMWNTEHVVNGTPLDNTSIEYSKQLKELVLPTEWRSKVNDLAGKFDDPTVYFANQIQVQTTAWEAHDIEFSDVIAHDKYTLIIDSIVGAAGETTAAIYDIDADDVTLGVQYIRATSNISTVHTVQEGTAIMRVRLFGSNGTSGSGTALFNRVRIVKGSEYKQMLSKSVAAQSISKEAAAWHATSSTVKSVAHRGYTAKAPECTAASYIEARKHGFTAAENDIQRTSDGYFVMWHDDTLSKIGDSEHSIADYTLDELKDMDFGSWYDNEFAGEKILTFREWVLLCKKLGMEIYVDRKITYTDAEAEELVETVRQLGMLDKTTWLGNPTVIRQYHPTARCAVFHAPTNEKINQYAEMLKQGGRGSIVFNPQSTALTAENAAIALDAGYGLECWHVEYPLYGFNTEESVFDEIERVIDIGVQAITIDEYRVEDAIAKRYF